jgi:hypothetical protein
MCIVTFAGSSPMASIAADGSVTLGSNNQDALSLPFDTIIESIYATINSSVTFTFPSGMSVYPFVRLYAADASTNTFSPLAGTETTVSSGYSGAVPANTPRVAATPQIGLYLPAGTRLLIGGAMSVSGTATLSQKYFFYFTGGIAVRPA